MICDRCDKEADELFDVQTMRATYSSPAEYEGWCRNCCEHGAGADDPHERAAARARSNDFERTDGKDWT